MTSQERMLKSALWYARHGWHVFPVHAPLFDAKGANYACTCEAWRRTEECKMSKSHLYLAPGEHCQQPGKCPACRWSEKSTTDENILRKWWSHDWRTKTPAGYTQFYTPNIGVDCGKSNILTLDIDRYKDFCGEIENLLPADDCQTITAISGGGGQHLIFNRQGLHYGNSCRGLPPGIDIRGAGGYFIVPPSLHKSGRRYIWEHGYGPHEIQPLPIPSALRVILDQSLHRFNDYKPLGKPNEKSVARAVSLVEGVLAQARINHHGQQEYMGGRRWILERCPFNPAGDPHQENASAFVIVLADGRIAAGCHHNRCQHVIAASQKTGWEMIKCTTVSITSPTKAKYPRIYQAR
jgi:hypothetical protein